MTRESLDFHPVQEIGHLTDVPRPDRYLDMTRELLDLHPVQEIGHLADVPRPDRYLDMTRELFDLHPSQEIGRLADVPQPDRHLELGLRLIPKVEDAHIGLEIQTLIMIYERYAGVKHFALGDIEVDLGQRVERQPRDLGPAGQPNLLSVPEHALIPGIHALEPAQAQVERVRGRVEVGRQPDAGQRLEIGVVTGREIKAVLPAWIKAHIARDVGEARHRAVLERVNAKRALLGR
jgi:hypothetical protein